MSLLQDNTFNSLLKEDFKKFFESNAGRTDTKAMEQEASSFYREN